MAVKAVLRYKTWDPATGLGHVDTQTVEVDMTTPAAVAFMAEVKTTHIGSDKVAEAEFVAVIERETA